MYRLIRRLLYSFTLWLGVVAATFALFHLVPTDPARTLLGANASEEQVAVMRERLGLDRPFIEQFRSYLGHLAKFDLGRSFVDGRPVGAEVQKRVLVTLALAGVAVALVGLYLAYSILTAGVLKWPRLAEASDFLCVAMPTLFTGVVVALLAASYYPFTRFSGSFVTMGDWLFLLPPALVLGLYPMGILGRIVRDQMHRLSTAEYVLAARARGLTEIAILKDYILRNAWVPLLAAFGNQLPLFLTSTFIVEIVFSVPGIGSLLLKSVLERDLPMLEGIVIVTALLTLLLSLILEALYPLADPRIRKDHAG